jgi:hypothetical protein
LQLWELYAHGAFYPYGYKEAYIEDEDSKEEFQQLQGQIHIEEGDNKDGYHF